MTSYRPCAGCAFGGQHCAERERVRAHIKGLAVSLVSWRCRWRQPAYRPGDAVWARLAADFEGPEGDVVYADFPAHVVQMNGGKVVVFVSPGAESRSGGYEFEPHHNSRGFCRTGIARISKRDAPAMNPCGDCGAFPEIHGHDAMCKRHPDWEKNWREMWA
ncbi:hypothetical protein [Amorphus sp. MBR-141]